MDRRITPARIVITYLLCGVMTIQPAMAKVVVSGSANTSVGQAGNGVEVVNIATPNNKGLSHNQFNQFDVDPSGLILNNSTEQFSKSQLGGILQNNPNLRGKGAEVILNEVTGANRSQLKGYTEVLGQQANVILTNPYGITCDGCGFINTPRVTLSTGAPQLNAGEVTGFDVSKGSVSIEGLGLDATNQTYFDIISRTAEINAGIHANDLSIVTGRNKVDYKTNRVTKKEDKDGNKPTLAIDSSALGGMYAGRIALIATEEGVGVNVGNLSASNGGITISADGKILLGDASGQDNLSVSGKNAVELKGKQYARQNITIEADTIKGNQTTIAGQNIITLDAENEIELIQSKVAAGINEHGQVLTQGSLSVKGESLNLKDSQLLVNKAITSEIASLNVGNGSEVAASSASFNKLKQVVNDGQLSIENKLSLNGSDFAVTGKGALRAQDIDIDGDSLVLNSSMVGDQVTIDVSQKLTIANKANINSQKDLLVSGKDIEQQGILQTNNALKITGGKVALNGDSKARTNINVTADDLSIKGKIKSGNNIQLDVEQKAEITKSGNVLANNDISLLTKDLSNSGRVQSGGQLNIVSQGTINNQKDALMLASESMMLQGANIHSDGRLTSEKTLTVNASNGQLNLGSNNQISSNSDINLQANSVLISGEVKSKEGVTLSSGKTKLNGVIRSEQDLTIQTEDLDLNGRLTSNSDIVISSQGDVTTNGSITAGKGLVFSANNLTNAAEIFSESNTALTILGRLNNQGDGLISGQDTVLIANSILNQGQVQALNNIELSSDSLSNSGHILAQNNATLTQTQSLISSGVISAESKVLLNADKLSLESGSQLNSGSTLTLQSRDLKLGGSTKANGRVAIDAAQGQVDGVLESESDISLAVKVLNLTPNSDLNAAGQLTLSGETVAQQGELNSKQSVIVKAKNIELNGKLNAERDIHVTGDDLALGGQITANQDIEVSAQNKITAKERLTAGRNLMLKAANFDNSAEVSAKRNVVMTLLASLSNLDGGLISGQNLIFSADSVTNLGQLQANNDVDVSSETLTNVGNIHSLNNVKLTQAKSLTSSGEIKANQKISLNTNNITLASGSQVTSSDIVTIHSKALTQQGVVKAKNAIDVESKQGVIHGKLESEGNIALAVNILSLTGNSTLNTNGQLTLAGQQLDLQGVINSKQSVLTRANTITLGGEVNAEQDITAQGNELTLEGQITANHDVTLNVQNDIVALGTVAAVGNLSLTADNLNSSAEISAKGSNTIALLGRLNNRNGGLISGQETVITASDIDNQGQIQALNNLNLTSEELNNSGQILAKNDVILTQTKSLLSNGVIKADSNVHLEADVLTLNETNQLSSGGALSLKSRELVMGGTAQAKNGINVDADQGRVNGILESENNIALAIDILNLTDSSSLNANNHVTLTGEKITQKGEINTKQSVTAKAGNIALNGEINAEKDTIVNGNTLILGGEIAANQDIEITAQVDVVASERLTAGRNLTLNAANLYSTAEIAAKENTVMTLLGSLNNQKGGLLSGQDVIINADSMANFGQTQALNNLTLTSETLNNDGRLLALNNATLNQKNMLVNRGEIKANQKLSLNADALTLEESSQLVSAGVLTIEAQDLNQSGSVQAKKNLTITAEQGKIGGMLESESDIALAVNILNLTANSNLNSNGQLTLSGDKLTQHGVINSKQSVLAKADTVSLNGEINAEQDITVEGNELTLSGQIAANQDLFITSREDITAASNLTADRNVTLNADNLDNTAKISGKGAMVMTLLGRLNNSNSGLISGQDTTLTASNIDNQGQIQALKDATINSEKLTNSGSIVALSNANLIQEKSLNNSGTILANKTVKLKADIITLDNGSQLSSGDSMTVSSRELTQSGAVKAKTDITITAVEGEIRGEFDSEGNTVLAIDTLNMADSSDISANGDVTINSDNVNQRGNISAKQSLIAKAKNAALHGSLNAEQDITVNANSLTLNSQITANRDLSVNTKSALVTSRNLVAGRDLTLDAASINNSAELSSSGNTHLTLGNGLINQNGGLISGQNTMVNASDVINHGQVQALNDLQIDSNALTSTGSIAALNNLTLTQKNALTNSGEIKASKDVNLKTDSLILEENSVITSAGVANLKSHTLNQDGVTKAQDAINVESEQAVFNGLLASEGNISLAANILNLTANSNLNSNGQLTLSGDKLTQYGVINSKQSLLAKANSVAFNGEINAEQDITVEADELTLGGQVAANQDLFITVQEDVTAAGNLTAGRNVTLKADNLESTAKISGKGAMVMALLGRLNNSNGGLISGQDTTLTASNINNQGQIQALNDVTLSSETLTNRGNIVALNNTALTQEQSLISSGKILANKAVKLKADTITLDTGSQLNSGDSLALNSREFTQIGMVKAKKDITVTATQGAIQGEIDSGGNTVLAVDTLNLADSSDISANGDVTISSERLTQRGNISTKQSLIANAKNAALHGTLNAEQDVSVNADTLTLNSQITANRDLSIDTKSALTTSKHLVAGRDLTLDVNRLENSAEISSSGNTRLTLVNGFTNQADGLISGQNTEVIASDVINHGQVQALNSAELSSNSLRNSGKILALNSATLTQKNSLTNSGEIKANQAVNLKANRLALEENSVITSAGVANLEGHTLNQDGVIKAQDAINVESEQAVFNGQLGAEGNIALAVNVLNLTANSNLSANGQLTLSGDKLTQQGVINSKQSLLAKANSVAFNGEINAEQDITVEADELTLGGQIAANQDLFITVQEDITAAGNLTAGRNVTLKADNLESTAKISGKGAMVMSLLGRLNNSNGGLISGQDSTLTASNINNQGQIQALNDVTLSSETLTNRGNIVALNNTALTQEQSLISSGKILANKAVKLKADTISLDMGSQLNSGDSLTLNSREFTQSGMVKAKKDITLTATQGAIQGEIDSGGNTVLTVDTLNLADSSDISANGDVTISSESLTQRGNISTKQSLITNAKNAALHGSLNAEQDVTVNADTLILDSQIIANRDLAVNTKSALTTSKHLVAGRDLSLEAASLDNNSAQISSSGNTQLTLVNGLTNQNGGLISGQNTLVSASDVVNRGQVQALNDLQIDSDALTNGGNIVALNSATLTQKNSLVNSGGIKANKQLSLKSASLNLDSHSQLISGGELSLNSDTLNQDGVIKAKLSITINSTRGEFNGEVESESNIALAVNILNLTDRSTLKANGQLTLSGDKLTQYGSINSKQSVLAMAHTIALNGDINAEQDITIEGNGLTLGGKISANQDIFVTAQEDVTVAGDLTAGRNVTLKADNLNNIAQISGRGATVVTLLGRLNNINGGLLSGQDTILTANNINNQGQIQALDDVEVTSDSMTNSGNLVALNNVTLTQAQSLRSSGAIQARKKIRLDADNLTLENGSVLTSGDSITVQSQALNQSGVVKAHKDITINASQGELIGKLSSEGDTSLTVDTLNLASSSDVSANGDISLTSKNLTQKGKINTKQSLIAKAKNAALHGTLNAELDATVDADTLTLDSQIIANRDVSVTTKSDLTNHKHLIAGRNLTLTAKSLDNSAQLSSAGNTHINVNNGFINQSAGLVSGNDTTLNAVSIVNHNQIQALNDLALTSSTLSNNGTILALNNADLTQTGSLINSGIVQADGKLNAKADHITVEEVAAFKAKKAISIDANHGDVKGKFESESDIALAIGILNLTSTSRLNSNGNLNLTSDRLTQHGDMSAKLSVDANANTLALNGKITAGLDVSVDANALTLNSQIAANRDINLTTQSDLVTRKHLHAGRDLSLSAASLSNSAQLSSQGDNHITLTGVLNNQSGGLISGRDTNITASEVTNQDQIQATNNLDLASESLANSGNILAINDATLSHTGALSNSGVIQSGAKASLKADTLTLESGSQLSSKESLTLNSRELQQDGVVKSQESIIVEAKRGVLKGRLESASNIALAIDVLNLASPSVLSTNGNISLTNESLTQLGQLNAKQSVVVNASDASLSGDINAGQDVSVNAANLTLNSQITANRDIALDTQSDLTSAKHLTAGRNFTLSAGSLDNQAQLSSSGNTNITLSGELHNQSSGLISGDNTNLSASSITNKGQVQSLTDLELKSEELNNSGNILALNKATFKQTGSLHNSGVIQAKGEALLDVAENVVLTDESKLSSGNSIMLNSDTLEQNGLVKAKKAITVNADSAEINGQLKSESNISLDVDTLDLADSSRLSANGDLLLTNETLTQRGEINTKKSLIARANSVVLNGEINAEQDVSVNATNLELNSQISANRDVTLTTHSDLTTNKHLTVGRDLSVNAGSLTNSAQISALGDTSIILTGALSNQSDGLISGKDTSLTASNINNNGQIQALNDLTMSSESLTNAGNILSVNNATLKQTNRLKNSGVIQIGKEANLDADNVVLDSGSRLSSGDALTVKSREFEQNGSIAAKKAMSITANHGTLNGGVKSEGDILLAVDDLSLTTQSRLEGNGDVTLTTDRLTQQGEINTKQSLLATANNARLDGEINAVQNVEVNANTLTLNNQITANRDLTLVTKSNLSTNKHLTAGGDLNLSAASLNNRVQLSASGDTKVTLTGGMTNQSNGLISGNNVTVKASNITNHGSLQALSNLGLNAASLTNHGATVALNDITTNLTGTLENRGVIYAGHNGYLYTNYLKNYSDVLTQNDLVIAKNASKAKSASVLNNTATIESLGGDISLYANEIKNESSGFTTKTSRKDYRNEIPDGGAASYTVSVTASGYSGGSRSYSVSVPKGSYYAKNVKELVPDHYIEFAASTAWVKESGKNKTNKHLAYIDKTEVVGNPKPSRIIARGDVALQANTIKNTASQIAGNNVSIDSNNLINTGAQLAETETYYVYRFNNRIDRSGNTFNFVFNRADIETKVQNKGVANSSITATGNVTLNVTNKVNNSTIRSRAARINSSGSASRVKGTRQANSNVNVNTGSSTVTTQGTQSINSVQGVLAEQDSEKVAQTRQANTNVNVSAGGIELSTQEAQVVDGDLKVFSVESSKQLAGARKANSSVNVKANTTNITAQATQEGVTAVQSVQGIDGVQAAATQQANSNITVNVSVSGIKTQSTQELKGVQSVQGVDGVQAASTQQANSNITVDASVSGVTAQNTQEVKGVQSVQSVDGVQAAATQQANSNITVDASVSGVTTQRTQELKGVQSVQGVDGVQAAATQQANSDITVNTSVSGVVTQSTQELKSVQGVQGVQSVDGAAETHQANTNITVKADVSEVSTKSTQGIKDVQSVNGVKGIENVKDTHQADSKVTVNVNTLEIDTRTIPQVSVDASTTIDAPDAVTPDANLVVVPEYKLPTTPNGLFVYSPAPKGKYLIETNPLLTDLDKFLGSKYFQKEVGFAPESDITFLGDAFYDTRTITQAIFEQTGKRYLTQNVGSDLEQMKDLIDAAAKAKSSLDLTVGVSLSADQIANLDQSILWYEEVEVNGQKVLAPKLYIAEATQDNFSGGAIIAAGNNISIQSGDMFNSGNVVAGNNLNVTSGGAITNDVGTLKAKGDLSLVAQEDISNLSGRIEGGNISLISHRGSIINKTLSEQVEYDSDATRTYSGERATISATGSLSASAGKEIVLQGGDINSTGDANLAAGGDITFVTNENKYIHKGWGEGEYKELRTVENQGSSLTSGGNVSLKSGGDLALTNALVSSQGDVKLSAGENLKIDTLVDESYLHTVRGGRTDTDHSKVHQGSTLSGDNIQLVAGDSISVKGSDIKAKQSSSLFAKGDVDIVAVNDSEYHYDKTVKKKSFGRKKVTINETYKETSKGSVVEAGDNITIVAQNLGTGITAGGDSDIQIIGSKLDAHNEVALSADGDVVLAAQTFKEFERHETRKKGFGGLSGRNKGNLSDATLLDSTYVINSGNTSIQSGNDIGVIASEVTSGGDVNLTAVNDVLITAGEVLEKTQQWNEKMSFLSGGNLFEMEKKRKGKETSTAKASEINSGGNLAVNAGSVKVIGSDLAADKNLVLTADTGDVEVLAAKETTRTFESEEKLAISGIDFVQNLLQGDTRDQIKIENGQLKINLGRATYDKVKSESDALNHRGSSISAGESLAVKADSSILVEGAQLQADTDSDRNGDVVLVANDDVTIKEAVDTLSERHKEVHGKAEANVVVQHQAVEVAKAVKAWQESKKALKKAKNDYKQYKKNLESLETTLANLEKEYAQKKPGILFEDIEELRDLVSGAKSDKAWYVTSISLATTDLASKSTAVIQQTGALVASTSSYAFGFNVGIQFDVEANQLAQDNQSTTSIASSVSGENITIRAGGDEGDIASVRGAIVQAKDNLALSGNDVMITSSVDTSNSRTRNESASVSASLTLFGATSGISVSGSYDRNESKSSSKTHNNSQLNANTISIRSNADTTIKGANVTATDELFVQVGGDLNVASVQNRTNSSQKGVGINAGVSLSGGQIGPKGGFISSLEGAGEFEGANGGLNFSNGRTNTKATVLTTLTSGKVATVQVANNTDIKGALIATVDERGKDQGNLSLTTKTLSYADLTNTRYEKSRAIGGSTGVSMVAKQDQPKAERSAESQPVSGLKMADSIEIDKNNDKELDSTYNSSSVQYKNVSNYSKSKTLATLGQGNLTITDSESSDDTSRLNRDTEHTEKDLFTVDRKQGDFDVTVDHRLLTEDGRNQIAEDVLKTDMFRETVERIITTERVGITDFFDETGKQLNVYNAVKQSIADDPRLAAKLQDPDLPAEAKEQMLDQLTRAAIKSLGYDAEGYGNKIIANEEDVRQGFHSKETGNSYINDAKTDGTEGLVLTAGHEMSHFIDAQTGDNEKYSKQDQETYAKNIGEDVVDYTDTALGVNGYGSMASTNNHVGNNSSTVVNNTHEYNGLDKSKGDNLIFAAPFVYEAGMAVTAATAAYLQANPDVAASIYDSLSDSVENAGSTLNEMLTIDPKFTDEELELQAVVVSSLLKDLEDQSRSTEDKLEIYRLIDEYDPKVVELAKERTKVISPNTGGNQIPEPILMPGGSKAEDPEATVLITPEAEKMDSTTVTPITEEQGATILVTPADPGVDVPLIMTATSGNNKLSGAENAVINPKKLTEYALNPDHPVGRHKARVFESALGFNKDNADDLLKQLYQGVKTNVAIPAKTDQYGKRFTVDIRVVGPKGEGVVTTGWIYKPDSDVPELTTLLVNKDK